MTYKETVKWAEEYSRKLKATDPGFNKSVSVIHEDGSVFLLQNSFAYEKSGFICIFTEHFGIFVFDKNDVNTIQYSKRDYQ